jgi:hypothetical protein
VVSEAVETTGAGAAVGDAALEHHRPTLSIACVFVIFAGGGGL